MHDELCGQQPLIVSESMQDGLGEPFMNDFYIFFTARGFIVIGNSPPLPPASPMLVVVAVTFGSSLAAPSVVALCGHRRREGLVC